MALIYDNSTNFGIVNYGSNNYTVGNGSDRIVYACVRGTGIQSNVTGVTYGGVAMTQEAVVAGNSGRYIYVFRMIAPAVGTSAVVVQGSGGTGEIGLIVISYFGAHQTSQPDSTATAQGNNTTIRTAITVVNQNCWVLAYGQTNGSPSGLAGSNSTLRQSATMGPTGAVADTNGIVAVGSNTIGFTVSSSIQWGLILIGIRPAPDAGGFFLTNFM